MIPQVIELKTWLNDFFVKRLENYFILFQAKSEAEVASEREFLSGEQIWLVHKGGFASARKLEDQVQDEGRCKVKLDHAGEELEVDEDDVERVSGLTDVRFWCIKTVPECLLLCLHFTYIKYVHS